VVEFTTTIPTRLKLAGLSHQKTKYILKKAMHQILPHEIIYRGKEGFSIPIKNWLKKELKPLMDDLLDAHTIRSQGLFNSTYVERLKREHLSGIANHSHVIWSMMVFQAWRRRWLEA
jgi:asparagine synthase (glutamine-hydrolysing)